MFVFESVGNYAKVFFGIHKLPIFKSLNALKNASMIKYFSFSGPTGSTLVNLRMIDK